MKALFFTVLTLIISNTTRAQNISLEAEGAYAAPKKIYSTDVHTRKSCASTGGQLIKAMCAYNVSDLVAIKQTDAHEFEIAIKTVHTNFEECRYEGTAQMINPVQMVSKSGDCEVTIGFQNPNTLAVWTNNQCQNLCNGRLATLQAENVKRLPPKRN